MRHKKKKQRLKYKVDEDDVPLTFMKRNRRTDVDPNSYDSLCVPSSQPCELCNQVSENRYKSLIHNVKHIIIPLLNQTVHQCDICLHHFTSIEDLIQHQSSKHTLAELISQTDLVSKNFNKPDSGTYESDLITIVKTEPDILKTALTGPVKLDSRYSNDSHSNGSFSIKNRLMFEEDMVSSNCDRLLTDLTTDCQVKVEIFPPIWNVDYPKSVHYNELIKPGVYMCKKCVKRFPSRFETIVHESQHIFIKNSKISLCKICNEYILGDAEDVLHHKLKTHWNTDKQDEERISPNHRRDFGAKIEENGDTYSRKTTTLKLCDLCFIFNKNRDYDKFECIGEVSEIGHRHKCQECGVKFFALKLVKKLIVRKCKPAEHVRRNRSKCMTNEDRLKIISNRFKMMRKCYFVVLFILNNHLPSALDII